MYNGVMEPRHSESQDDASASSEAGGILANSAQEANSGVANDLEENSNSFGEAGKVAPERSGENDDIAHGMLPCPELSAEEFPLDRYEPVAIIGKGTVGTIYLCRDRRLHRKKVAVKVLRAVSDEDLVSFHQEARATSRLNHRNIIAVYDFGATSGGVPYMAMEYADGISLDRLIRTMGPLDHDRALKIAIGLADALAYAHSCGIFHRDIKASNILLVRSDNRADVRLIDFGMAVVHHSADAILRVQGRTIVGTPQYMSPDQGFGLPYDERSEVYSLGCVLFEMLTGKPPFQAETALEIMALHAKEPIPSLAAAHGGHNFSPRLEALIARCLAKNREDRYASMYSLKVDLEKVIDRQYAITLDRINVADTPGRHDRDPTLSAIMIALICFSAASWLAYLQIERVLSKNAAPAVVSTQRRVDLTLPSLDDYSVGEEGFIRAYNYGRLVIQANHPISDDDLKTLSTERDLSELKLLSPILKGDGVRYLAPTSLARLVIKKGSLSDEALTSISGLKDLKHIELISCGGISHAGIACLKQLPALENLVVADCGLSNDDLKEIAQIPTLAILDYARNRRANADTISELGRSTRLRYLAISPEQLDFKGYQAIAGIPALQGLAFVGDKKLDERELLTLKDLPKLSRITFADQCVRPQTLKLLADFPHLIRLEMNGKGFGDKHLESLDGSHVNHLVLSDTSITDKGFVHVLKLPRLQRINLRRCSGISLQTINSLSKQMKDCDIVVL